MTSQEPPSGSSLEEADRGPGWEYLLFMVELKKGLASLAEDIADYRAGYVDSIRDGPPLTTQQAMDEITTRMAQAKAYMANLDRLFVADLQERAFGLPGEPGDEVTISYLADRITDVFRNMLRWAQEIRGTLVEDDVKPVVWAVSNYVRKPIDRYEAFVKEVDERMRPPIEELRAGRPPAKPITVELNLTVDVDDADVAEFEREVAELTARRTARPD
jgi:hypothetical protein